MRELRCGLWTSWRTGTVYKILNKYVLLKEPFLTSHADVSLGQPTSSRPAHEQPDPSRQPSLPTAPVPSATLTNAAQSKSSCSTSGRLIPIPRGHTRLLFCPKVRCSREMGSQATLTAGTKSSGRTICKEGVVSSMSISNDCFLGPQDMAMPLLE